MNHTCICPECKNSIDLTKYPTIDVGHVIECTMCGITLEVTSIDGEGVLTTEIVDERK